MRSSAFLVGLETTASPCSTSCRSLAAWLASLQLSICQDGIRRMRQALKPLYIRAIRSYRTISYMAATTLAGSPLVEFLYEERRILYWRIKELREEGVLTARDSRALKSQAVARTLEKWGDILSDPRGYGRETAEAVRPCLPELAGRRGCGLSYHLVQVLTGHGCFGKYLHQIGKELTTRCHHCPVLMDTALNTLAACPAWTYGNLTPFSNVYDRPCLRF
ncbi:uncharacterized protein LOC112589411 [Harpegnathos saltator]|uniref:uncharacterized protein LOC112589411 n=1 Tax=Harpegnathos saltator TaxID=610380 RepID=UPI000DBEE82C|nr:uncharacterized protein LOC112589411 [Harpegnathos saltator]